MWFCYEATMTGKMHPVLYAEKPGKKAAGSHTPRRSTPVKIKPDEENLSLEILERIYPNDTPKST